MAKYPFGSIDYGFFPLTQADLLATLASTTPYVYSFVATTIPDLQNNKLPIEERDIAAGQHLDSVFKEIPTNTIIDKTICGVVLHGWRFIPNATRLSLNRMCPS